MFRMVYPKLSRRGLEARLRFKPLWERGIKGQGVTVAVLDTGVRNTEKMDVLITAERDFTGENQPRRTKSRHGAAVAKGICLVAPEARIASFKVIPASGLPTRETVCQAIHHCIQKYPAYAIINLSLYFMPDSCTETNRCSVCAAANEAVRAGIVVVAAAGNRGPEPGTITCPGLADEAITVCATWTKRQVRWWVDLSRLKRWWWKVVTGDLGRAFGTSFSAAYASGGVALLKSAFPEGRPGEIREAIFNSAYRLQGAPPGMAGTLQCKEALDGMLNPSRYEWAKRALYINAGNREAQKESPYIAHELGFALSYIRYELIAQSRYVEARNELSEIRGWLFPGALPNYEKMVQQILELCPAAQAAE
jgi:subtilisin family serine protease